MRVRIVQCAVAALAAMAAPSMAPLAHAQGAGTSAVRARGPVDEGAGLFRGYCAPCHGARGVGDGPVASALKSTPTDLTRLSIENKGGFPAQRVAMVIEFGVVVAAHGTTDMPTWGPTFRLMGDEAQVRERVRALTRYLETIQAK